MVNYNAWYLSTYHHNNVETGSNKKKKQFELVKSSEFWINVKESKII